MLIDLDETEISLLKETFQYIVDNKVPITDNESFWDFFDQFKIKIDNFAIGETISC